MLSGRIRRLCLIPRGFYSIPNLPPSQVGLSSVHPTTSLLYFLSTRRELEAWPLRSRPPTVSNQLTPDRPNLELMSHFEGPVVDSFYEVALHSWHNQLEPPLPCLAQPYQPPVDAAGRVRYLFKDRNPYFDDLEILKAARAARMLLRKEAQEADDERLASAGADDHPFRDAVQRVMDRRREMADQWAEWKPGEELNARAQNAMLELREFRDKWGLGSRANSRMGSRSNSRAPSRRASTDMVYRPGRR